MYTIIIYYWWTIEKIIFIEAFYLKLKVDNIANTFIKYSLR